LSATVIGDVLRGCSFDVTDLGPDVPADAFVSAVGEREVSFVGLSWSTPGLDDAVAETVAGLRRHGDVPILLGGAAASEDAAERVGADHHVGDGRDMIALAERLFWR
jgi:methanogenic corrinoid protein MtbC1